MILILFVTQSLKLVQTLSGLHIPIVDSGFTFLLLLFITCDYIFQQMSTIADAESNLPARRIFWTVGAAIPIALGLYKPVYTPSRELYTMPYIRRQLSFIGNTVRLLFLLSGADTTCNAFFPHFPLSSSLFG